MGEGAGIVVLESAEHAKARGAKIYGEIAGVGITGDAHHIAAPEPEGREQTRAMELAMADANVSPADIVHRSEEHTYELQPRCQLVCRLPLETTTASKASSCIL